MILVTLLYVVLLKTTRESLDKMLFFIWRPFCKSEIVSFKGEIELENVLEIDSAPQNYFERPNANFYAKMPLNLLS